MLGHFFVGSVKWLAIFQFSPSHPSPHQSRSRRNTTKTSSTIAAILNYALESEVVHPAAQDRLLQVRGCPHLQRLLPPRQLS